MALDEGASAVGFAVAEPVDERVCDLYADWIARGCHGEMSYLDRYHDVRSDPRLLLPGASTVIVAAFNYKPEHTQPSGAPRIAAYALGRDYHEVVRARLSTVAARLCGEYGGEARVCVDTAPIRERYWAVRAGVGFVGVNSQLIVPGVGSMCFLGEIIWTGEVTPDEPCTGHCDRCMKCVAACPGGAIGADGSFDARRCHSYLTIEYRGELPSGLDLGDRLYGCDVCQQVCPHNCDAEASSVAEFRPSDEVLALDAEKVRQMTPEEFSRMFRHSAVKRTRLSGLQRNLARLAVPERDVMNG